MKIQTIIKLQAPATSKFSDKLIQEISQNGRTMTYYVDSSGYKSVVSKMDGELRWRCSWAKHNQLVKTVVSQHSENSALKSDLSSTIVTLQSEKTARVSTQVDLQKSEESNAKLRSICLKLKQELTNSKQTNLKLKQELTNSKQIEKDLEKRLMIALEEMEYQKARAEDLEGASDGMSNFCMELLELNEKLSNPQ
jgi:hypothetical protein